MNIKVLHLINGARLAEGLTVVIDVFRAFSTACYAINNGAREIIPVGDINRAYQLKAQNSDFILMGERGGKVQPGFDYGNSPTQIEAIDFSGKAIVQTTSAGTQGFANATKATELISGSFVNVDAVVAYIRLKSPAQVSLVCMGTQGIQPNTEDTLCGGYIRDKLLGKNIDIDSMMIQLKNSPSAGKFKDPLKTWFPEKDLELCLDINRFGFVLRAVPYKNGMISLKSIQIKKEADQ